VKNIKYQVYLTSGSKSSKSLRYPTARDLTSGWWFASASMVAEILLCVLLCWIMDTKRRMRSSIRRASTITALSSTQESILYRRGTVTMTERGIITLLVLALLYSWLSPRWFVALAMWLGVGILTAAAALLVLLVGEAVGVRP
jgi:hypothetical protein